MRPLLAAALANQPFHPTPVPVHCKNHGGAQALQVRVANRQDEPAIRNFVSAIYEKDGQALNLESSDADLRNIEANYFGREGLFLLGEEDNSIIAIAAARKQSDTVLVLRRLLALEQPTANEVVSEMLRVVLGFAPRLLYEKIDCEIFPIRHRPDRLLEESGFDFDGRENKFSLRVSPDF